MVGTTEVTGSSKPHELAVALAEIESLRAENERLRGLLGLTEDAIHNMPGFPLHSVVVKPGPIYAAVRSLVIRFSGRTSHAAEPDKGENPSLAIADLLRACDRLTVNDLASPDSRVITPVHVLVGSPAYGVSAGEG